MKTLILLAVLIQSISFAQMEFNTHYNTIANNMKFLKISESNVLLYGDNGVIIRSSDAGESWTQNFSGTHSDILKLINVNGNIYGVNNNFEFMFSEDGGDYWKYKKTNYNFNDLCVINNNVFISTVTNKFYITDFSASNFQEKIAPVDSIFYIFSKNENLFIVDRNFSIYISKDMGDSWKKFSLNTVMSQFRYKYINNNLYIYGLNEIVKINDDLSLSNYVLGIKKYYEFYEYDNGFIIINSSLSNRVTTKYFYDISDKSLTTIGTFKFKRMQKENLFLNDVCILNGILFNSLYCKTLVKSEALSNDYEVKMYMPYIPRYVKFHNNKEISIIDQITIQTIYSNDGGKNLILNDNYLSDPYLDDIGEVLLFKDIYFNDDNRWYYLFKPSAYNTPLTFAYYTTDRGKSFDSIPQFRESNTRFIDYKNNSIYINSKKIGMNSILKLDLSNNELTEVNSLNNTNSIFFQKLNNDEYLIFTSEGYPNSNDQTIKLLKTSDNFKTFQIIDSIEHNNLGSIYRYNNNLIFIETMFSTFFKVNLDNPKFIPIEDTTLTNTAMQGFSDIHPTYIESNTITMATGSASYDMQTGQFSFSFSSYYAKLDFENDKFIEDSLGQSTYMSNVYISDDGTTKYYYSPRHLFIPIEPERLSYYSSITENSTPSSIWVYPPYPNPVHNNVSINFKTWEMNNIQNLNIDLVEISSGKIFPINDFKLILSDQYSGSVNFNTNYFTPGAYLINFKLGNSNKSEYIIIE